MCEDVIVVGSINFDFVTRVPRLPASGETIAGFSFAMIPGGKGANQAVAAARLRAGVSMIGRVGNDHLGEDLLRQLRHCGVDVSCVDRVDGSSGVATILVDQAGANQIAIFAGANERVDPDYVQAEMQNVRRPKVCLLQLEIPMEAVCCAAVEAKERGAYVILDPAPAVDLPGHLLDAVDLVVPNEHEAAALTGIVIANEHDARQASDRLLEMGAKAVVIKMGDRGLLFRDHSIQRFVESIPVTAVDTTAAGDAFAGALAAAFVRDASIDYALRFASAAGAHCATKRGAQPSLPTPEEVEALLGTDMPAFASPSSAPRPRPAGKAR